VTDSHNSGQHKDREAAAAEVRRMWQPTPSWSQPDPAGTTPDPEPVDEQPEDKPADALAQEFPGDSWNQPETQPTQPASDPWTQPAGDGGDSSTASGSDAWTQPAGDAWNHPAAAQHTPAKAASDAWTQPAPEPEEHHQPLSPAAQHFFPQGVPGQHAPQPQREVSYRTDELIQALPLPREAPAERGVRSMLKMRPGSSERTERIARATAATAFRRPVTITVANPKGGSGKTPTTLLLAGALGQARGGGVVAWDNNELRGNMHLRTHDTNARSTVTDLLQAMPMLTQPDARLGDVAAYLRHQVAGQYDVLTSATTTYAQIEAKDFDQVHRLLSRFYKVLVIDTGNNEGSSNWREAMKASDALVIPIKWKSLSCAAAVQMLEELDNQGPEAQRLIRRAVIAVSNGPGDVNKEVEKQLRPYFESRAAAVVDIPTDPHIAAEGPLDHSALLPATRRAGLELAARVAEQITIALNVPR
jgi:MinD-like ATPase involved in chromosome partitioning or flagellar assembly